MSLFRSFLTNCVSYKFVRRRLCSLITFPNLTCLCRLLFVGEFLALTGDRLNGSEMMASGLATHYLHSSVNSRNLFHIF